LSTRLLPGQQPCASHKPLASAPDPPTSLGLFHRTQSPSRPSFEPSALEAARCPEEVINSKSVESSGQLCRANQALGHVPLEISMRSVEHELHHDREGRGGGDNCCYARRITYVSIFDIIARSLARKQAPKGKVTIYSGNKESLTEHTHQYLHVQQTTADSFNLFTLRGTIACASRRV
jgi:hypothetical protein